MPRPRLHDVDALLDQAEAIVARDGAAALTVRALAQAAGAPSGTIYHAFGSRDAVLARVWLRAAERFGAVQGERVAGAGDPVGAVVAAATAPLAMLDEAPQSARVLLALRREDLPAGELPAALVAELHEAHRRLVALLRRLAEGVFGRRDAPALEAVTVCVVDLPTALVLRPLQRDGRLSPAAAARLDAAVRAVLDLPLPPPRTRTRKDT
ncbi:TetR/AcrR family transcriptional regulator [Conexibacter sp. SYSU D00693]|uniref:TetR/AcrR family transcriptional regulator n=1 Tax=Conexibacter sp. SYSU D00693 TaxID=2812560 RepID=UPI00196A2FB9|nr:TetR/AcrR family transcriptional regulator [Conexibacter sp. SYSU D00693]